VETCILGNGISQRNEAVLVQVGRNFVVLRSGAMQYFLQVHILTHLY